MSAQYVFKKLRDPENSHDNTDVIVRLSAVTLDELERAFGEFLRACGFDGSIKVNIDVDVEVAKDSEFATKSDYSDDYLSGSDDPTWG
ncbi:MAG: hypothetical protein C5B47_00630 [Verrucomicrobia bacterium]|nr:MAG: hypothetical protein C5B47_00630 [Verrucomicrobiota bacterium]